jgi:hypothetical protein
MKQKDIALIIMICFVAGIFSFIVSSLVFGGSTNKNQQAEVVDKVTTEFPQPSARYFNQEALNPTQTITIGDQNNQNPFASSSN